MNATRSSSADPRLAVAAKVLVGATFSLIFVGALVTSYGSGMAVPDWPLSFGSLNPSGWWRVPDVLREHGHRLFAASVGLLTGILCAWIWENWRALLFAALGSVVAPLVGYAVHASPATLTHLRLWPAAIAFLCALFMGAWGKQHARTTEVRWLAVAAFVGVCIQATLGGLRVTQESGGALESALAFRVVHGCFGQAFLGVLVALAAQLAPGWSSPRWSFGGVRLPGVRRLAWFTVAMIFGQLMLGAAMRHPGAGLAIPTWPQARADGGWLPAVHAPLIEINFSHTRIGAVLVTLSILVLAVQVWRCVPGEGRLTRPAALLVGLVALQFTLGVLVIWHAKPPMLTSVHVVNGAAVLATALLLALRASHFEPTSSPSVMHPRLQEVHA